MQKWALISTLIMGLYGANAFSNDPTPSSSLPKVSYKRAREEGVTAAPRGRMTILTLDGQSYVPVRQFCGVFGCKAIYQWDKHRLVIENTFRKSVALLSHLTEVVILDGFIYRFKGRILVTEEQGYLLPLDLAVSLAGRLQLGTLTLEEAEEAHGIITDGPEKEELKELKTVIIDAGHGGFDIGTSEGSLHEKDIALFYAQRLRDELFVKVPGLDVQLTRDTDRFVSLGERTRFANQKGASLFISLHVNHADNREITGAETYILSPDATETEARKTQLLENESWVNNAKVGELPTSEGIKRIFVDLEQQHYIRNSALFGAFTQQELSQIDGGKVVKNRGVKQAFFYVLSQAAMPAVLIEMGFLSNKSDRARLMNTQFRERFVTALTTAVIRYKARLQVP